MKKIVAVVLVILVVGYGAYYLLTNGVTDETLVSEGNALVVLNQKPGNEVVVSYAKLAKPGYVLVHTTDATGQKTLVGSSNLLPAGEHKNVKVPRRGGGSSGSRISASIVVDDGNGALDEAEINSDPIVEGEATLDTQAEDISDLTDEEIIEALEEAGYEINEMEDETDSEIETDNSDQGDIATTTDDTSTTTEEVSDDGTSEQEAEETL